MLPVMRFKFIKLHVPDSKTVYKTTSDSHNSCLKKTTGAEGLHSSLLLHLPLLILRKQEGKKNPPSQSQCHNFIF